MHLPREENQMADALATLASTWEIGKQVEMKPLILVRSRTPCYEEIRIMPINPVEKAMVLRFVILLRNVTVS